MKQLALILVGTTALLTACLNNPDGKKADTRDSIQTSATTGQGTELKIDTSNSKLEWHGKKVTGSHQGEIKISSGSVFIENEKLTGGSFTIDMASLVDQDLTDPTKKNKLETHLKSPDFFDVQKYPISTFKITEVKELGDSNLTISGNLTIRDVTKNITFNATVLENTADKFSAKSDFNINRQDWGVAYKGMQDDLISDEINFKINLTAVK